MALRANLDQSFIVDRFRGLFIPLLGDSLNQVGCYFGGGIAVRVLIADDHRLMVEGTKQALERAGGFEVVGEAVNGVQVLPLVRRLKPELVLLDLRMPQMDGLTCLSKIRKEFPDIKVAILSVSQDPELIQTALKRGANAYIVKTIDPDDLAAALRQAIDGTVFTTAGLTEDPGQRAARDAGLTERELGIIRAVARGLSNEAISKELWVAEQTVKFHLTNIYRKLGVANRTEAARYAFEHGLVDQDHDHPS
jgi:DNA-binding NarL/FixJ family response regulator